MQGLKKKNNALKITIFQSCMDIFHVASDFGSAIQQLLIPDIDSVFLTSTNFLIVQLNLSGLELISACCKREHKAQTISDDGPQTSI